MREQLGKLSKLEEARVGVGREIMLRKRGQSIELRAVRLKKTGNLVDAALARLSEGVAFDASKLRGLGVLSALREEPLQPGDRVAKVGRTTGVTRGIVSAIEVDRVLVGYDRGELRFDDQVDSVSQFLTWCDERRLKVVRVGKF